MLRIDTHRHLGGSIPVEFVWGVIQKHNLKHLGESIEEVHAQMTFKEGETAGFHRFLDKFRILDEIKWSEELIDDSVKAIADCITREKLDYVFLDFSINKYMALGWHKSQAIKFIYDSFQKHIPNKVGLILSLKYESMRASQRQYAKLIEDSQTADCLVGIDLVGDEAYFDADFYEPIFKEWREAGKMTRAHVGESQGVENIVQALHKLKVTNVAHGFKIVQDREGMAWAKDQNISFDMTITSNHLTGVWTDKLHHPMVDMHRDGLVVTMGSDDPIQCSTDLDWEFRLARTLGFSHEDIDKIKKNAISLYYHFASEAALS